MENKFIEISESELASINGGFWAALAAGVLIAAAANIIGDWDNFKNGLAGRRAS